jgi:TolB-like protein
VEFASVVDALRCAAEVQRGIAERNAVSSVDTRIEFRVGIHQGDIVVEDGDIFGDGVNVAARLESLAEPGGICVSARVQEDAAGRLDLAFEDMGEQALKNIVRPVRVYRVATAAGSALTRASSDPALPDKPSIPVLPFTNMSGDPEQEYFADGITEDLTTDLSRIADMLVISRNSAFTYKDKSVNAKQIGRELCVRYVLEGSIRRSGNRVRVNAQLIDAETNVHVWAERFDFDTGDLFVVQDEITSRIAVALDLELVEAEAACPIEHPDALDYILRGRAVTAKPRTRGNWAEMISLFERALALDPRSVSAQSWLATVLTSRVLDEMADKAAADMARAEQLVEQALALSPHNLLGHYAKAQVLRAQGRYNEAIPEYETVLTINRNWVGAIAHLGQCKLFTGSIEETIPLLVRAIRVSPRDGQVANWYWRIELCI